MILSDDSKNIHAVQWAHSQLARAMYGALRYNT